MYHLLALALVSKYLPFKSVFFNHAVISFRNHYGIDLMEEVEKMEGEKDNNSFTIVNHQGSRQGEEEEDKEEEREHYSQIDELGHTF